jgi:hypothetical protein
MIAALGAAVVSICHSPVRAAAPQVLPQAPQRHLTIRWAPDPAEKGRLLVEVVGLSAAALKRLEQVKWGASEWNRLFSVYAVQTDLGGDRALPAMLGSYRIATNALQFAPQFPFEPGPVYRAVFWSNRVPGEISPHQHTITATLQLPPPTSSSVTVVTRVYPSMDVVPENLLKFYIYFSAPMSRGRVYDHIHLNDQNGKEIDLPFLEIDEELWDSEMKRLTLFIDPGRIKRGVRPLEEVGAALEEGKSYSLVIDSKWKDAAGNPLKETFRKNFEVGPPDRETPDPTRWKLQLPKPDTREPLTLNFQEPMDHALAQRLIRVFTASGQPVRGKIVLENHEHQWVFAPDAPWTRATYRIAIQTTIEDLAGNNVGKPFDVDLFESIDRGLNTSKVNLSFDVR